MIKSNKYRYQLEAYRGQPTRYTCPLCGHQKAFTRYLDKKTGLHLDSSVGRCNREINCGYHYTPKQFFENKMQSNYQLRQKVNSKFDPNLQNQLNGTSQIERSMFEQSLEPNSKNNFITYLLGLFGSKLASYLVNRYFVGSAKHWEGATVFWQIDKSFNIRTGKIILYDPDTGNRIKKPFNHITWAHTLLKIQDFNLQQCFFAEHLLRIERNKPIAIVESEKTAIVASVYMPQLVWLACGGINELTHKKLKVLSGRKILLIPDLNAFAKWKQKSIEIQERINCNISVSEILELNASERERGKGLDIADYLIKRDDLYGWALSMEGYPLFWDK